MAVQKPVQADCPVRLRMRLTTCSGEVSSVMFNQNAEQVITITWWTQAKAGWQA